MSNEASQRSEMIWKGAAALCVLGFMVIVASAYAFRGRMPETTEPGWPPVLGQRYPNLTLTDAWGRSVSLESLSGKPLLIELVGMRSAASQAFAGAAERGGLFDVKPQASLLSLERHFAQLGQGVTHDDPRIHHVKILIYGEGMDHPSPAEIGLWARHFGFDAKPNVTVLGGGPTLIGGASYTRIPGFHLVDREFILRVDAAGYKPPHSLFDDLLARIGSFLE